MREDKHMINFPKDFLWGTSTSGPQTEGRFAGDGKGDNLWDYWYQVEPHRFRFQEGPGLTSTFYENWEGDRAYCLSDFYPMVSDFP